MIGQYENEIDDARRWSLTRFLIMIRNRGGREEKESTSFCKISSGVVGGIVRSSEGSRAALRQFFIRGASCAFPSVFCNEGTG